MNLIRVGSVLAGVLLMVTQALAVEPLPTRLRIYPSAPTPGDLVYAVVSYPCPYPSDRIRPKIIQQGQTITLEVATFGNVCFTQNPVRYEEYSFPIGTFGAGAFQLLVEHRFTSDGVNLSGFYTPTLSKAFAVRSGVSPQLSGMWFNPTKSGHGLQITAIDANRALVYWNTFDPAGKPLWLVAEVRGEGQEVVGTAFRFSGMRFGSFNPADARGEKFGELRFRHAACNELSMIYTSELAGFGTGRVDWQPLARPAGLPGCAPELISGAL